MIVDLRSDVRTQPTSGMLEAIVKASFGDDVFDEEPTVHALQERVANLTGKEAALFVVSGTMANQLAIASQTSPRDEVILDLYSHIFQYEVGSPSALAGVQTRPIKFTDCVPDEDELRQSIRFKDLHQPTSRLLCLEITHNYHGGAIADVNKVKAVTKIAHDAGLKVHIDGARIWNAVIASGIPIKEYTSFCDTIMFCFSKGLGTPVGSILAGPKETIERATYLRKGWGGGWRKPGLLAAAALYALDHHTERLAEDHAKAKRIAEAIEANPRLILARRVDTNMVFFRPNVGAALCGRPNRAGTEPRPYCENLETYSNHLTAKGILHDWRHFNAIRLVTHMGITDEMIGYVVDALNQI